MQRVPHDKKGTWIQEFKYVNKSEVASRYYLDNASVLLYTVTLSLDDSTQTVKTTYPTEVVEDKVEITFGQFLTPFRNMTAFKRFYFNYDISFNRRGRFGSFPEIENSTTDPQLVVDGELLSTFCARYDMSITGTNFPLSVPRNFYKLYLGYNHVRNFGKDIKPIKLYEGITSEILADISDNCFTWVEIVDGELDVSEIDLKDFTKSSSLLLDYKLVIDKAALATWVTENYSYANTRILLDTLGTTGLDVSFLFYPPVAAGLQLEDKPIILSPTGIVKSKLVSEVVFSVGQSFVDQSQKVFEIYFKDTLTNDILFRTDSLESYKDFTMVGKNINIVPEYLEIENSIFEDLSGINYPTRPFKVTYTIPNDLKKFLSSHLNYTILVRITDLTSERVN